MILFVIDLTGACVASTCDRRVGIRMNLLSYRLHVRKVVPVTKKLFIEQLCVVPIIN